MQLYGAIAILMMMATHAAVQDDLVGALPGFPPPSQRPMKSYSGFLNVTLPNTTTVAGYTGWVIHYQLEMKQGTVEDHSDETPLTLWHTGGPGGSSIYGLYGEAGYFAVSQEGTAVNPYAWNLHSHMLYLESPAGSFLSPVDQHSGFSYCLKAGGVKQETCRWNDKTQAEAYAHTLRAFYQSFPELSANPLHLAGESYAGQYIPNIAHFLLTQPDLKSKLKGIAVGNGCWGGNATSVNCNGPNEERDLVELYHGKGLCSKALYTKIQHECRFPDWNFRSGNDDAKGSKACEALLDEMDAEVGPHDIYDVYNNCPALDQWLSHTGKTTRWLRNFLRRNLHNPEARHQLAAMAPAGYTWTCGQFAALPAYLLRPDVRKALHMPIEGGGSSFAYDSLGPASVTLYPDLLQAGLRVLIYNGDADSCVPYVGNEAWTAGMAEIGVAEVKRKWHPWYMKPNASRPSGAATTYNVPGNKHEFAFVTIRLAGHEVPHFAPPQALELFRRFVGGEGW